MVKENIKKGNINFTTDLESGIKGAEIVFIAVGTPMGADGSADLKYVLSVAEEIGKKMQDDIIIVDKSTVPVGTADKVRAVVEAELKNRNSNLSFDIVSNPEFLKGCCNNDFMTPDRVVVGANNDASINKMKELYSPFLELIIDLFQWIFVLLK